MNKVLRAVLAICLWTSLLGSKAKAWHAETTVYQIYPRSFQDSDGDGIGDLKGIIERLDILQELGVETLWISPFFQSPQADWGYDISDYTAIAKEYGDLATVQSLIGEIHRRGMRVIFDLVMNHTSDQHPWFQDARTGTRGQADMYVWAQGKGRRHKRPPTNWKSLGKNGWVRDTLRGEFYWTSFLPFQPDLNYRNPAVKTAMFDVVRYWLKQGVDGFRLDMFNAIYEDSLLRNNPFSMRLLPSEENPDGFFQKAMYNMNQVESCAFSTELRGVLDEFPGGKYLVGEVYGSPAQMRNFCSYQGKPGLHSVFLFETLSTPFKAKAFREMLERFEREFPEPLMPTWVFSNHDRVRAISRLGNDLAKAKLLATFQLCVRGIPFIYYGDEIGIPQGRFARKTAKDPLARAYPWLPTWLVRLAGQSINRDECRSPMDWEPKVNGGFSAQDPWIAHVPALGGPVSAQRADSSSLWHTYRGLLLLRKSNPALHKGALTIPPADQGKDRLVFKRTHGNATMTIALNFSKHNSPWPGMPNSPLLFNTHSSHAPGKLLPWQGLVFQED